MIINKETVFTKDAANKKIKVERTFDAPVQQVWKAWTESDLLDQWWAPKPWQAVTKSMDFREGGSWFYYMQGPDGTRHYCRVDYKTITPQKAFNGEDAFCDESGTPSPEMPRMHWQNEFTAVENTTKVNVEISFASEAALEQVIQMGFKEGFAAAHKNLDEILSSKS